MSRTYDPGMPYEAAFHQAIKGTLTRRQQGYVMGAFRAHLVEAGLAPAPAPEVTPEEPVEEQA